MNYEIDHVLTWSVNGVISDVPGAPTLAITDTKLYVPVVTFSTGDSAKL